MSENIMRCDSCFEEYAGQGRCPFCGYDPERADAGLVALAPGTVLKNRYRIGRVLGQGGFGITYLAWDNLFRTKVAMKEYMPSDFCARSRDGKRITAFAGAKSEVFFNGKKRFLEEAQALAMFNTVPAIVSVKDFFEENDTAYYAMEYIEGCTLSQYINRKGVCSVDETVRLMLPIIECLERIHADGLLHRDIAPDNIMITTDGQAKLIDFGSARFAAFNSNEKSLTVMVKQGYSAPEQYLTKGARGPFTDVYALGATMYKMLTGVTPPESIERKSEMLENETDPLEPIARYAPDAACLEPVIRTAMNVYAAKRIQSAKEMYDRTVNAVPRAARACAEPEPTPFGATLTDRSVSRSGDKTLLLDDSFEDPAAPSGHANVPRADRPLSDGGEDDSAGEKTVYDQAPPQKPDSGAPKPEEEQPPVEGETNILVRISAAVILIVLAILLFIFFLT